MCNRTKTMDKWCQQFIDNYAGEPIQVLNLCCGLDARCHRVRRNPHTVRWIDVDIPAVVNLRERVMISGSGDYSLRNLSITTDGWFRDIPADRRTMIICENFLYYVDAVKVQNMIRDLVNYFGAGQFVFDTAGSLTAKYRPEHSKKLSLQTRWTIDDVRGIETYHPKLKLTGRVRWQEYMGNDGPMGQNLPPVFGPWTTALLSLKNSTAFKDVLQAVRFDFGERATSASSSEFTRGSFDDDNESKFSGAVALTPTQSKTVFYEG
ncbi:S-adenosyl-L-methionine-dependent methyltransferase [Coniella lustricola]|uniref:S-adenosyl-L-methionine-dependent methyltransferase n=1 Tax=Coniella lustricola TaxID=2025994 RepID=A0A2T3AIE0_9PEZI|nr:S-adenosyl-L-methionine-dependent methyltransferase [Coniella lustricola]